MPNEAFPICKLARDRGFLSPERTASLLDELAQFPEDLATGTWLLQKGALTREQLCELRAELGFPAVDPDGASQPEPPRDADTPAPALDATAVHSGPASRLARLPKIPGYRLDRELGRGGMGVVYKAWQENPPRWVALKVLLAGDYASDEDLQRFHREIAATARLRHPGIVPIHEASEHDGRPFYTMDLLEGESLDEYLKARDPGLRERLELFVEIAEVIHFAHQRGVIHRDLKPANVLVDPEGRPHVLDFGIAKIATDEDGQSAEVGLTGSGRAIGTPQYMSPEQTTGDADEVDVRTDVYALGMMLFEMLTGQYPYAVRENSLEQLIHAIRFEEPRRPSLFDRRLRGDLETILLKALEKDKERRYQSAAELSGDLLRYLRHEPILARPTGCIRRSAKWVRRHPAATAILATIAVACALVIGTSTLSYLRVRRERDLAQQQRQLAEKERNHALQAERKEADQRRRAESERNRALAAEKDAKRQREEVLRELYLSKVRLAHQGLLAYNVAHAHALLQECTPRLRNWEWGYVMRLCRRYLRTLSGHQGEVTCVAFSPDGKWLASGSKDKTIGIWHVSTGRAVATLRCRRDEVTHVTFSPDGKLIASAGRGRPRRAWDDVKIVAAFSPDGKRIASAGDGGTIRLWAFRPSSEWERQTRRGGAADEMAAGPEGSPVSSGRGLGIIKVWDVETGRETMTLRGHGGHVDTLVYGPDGKPWTSGGRIYGNRVKALAFGPEGNRIASGSEDATIRLWDALTGREKLVLLGHGGDVNAVAFSPDGSRIASGSWDTTVRLWNSKTGRETMSLFGHGSPVHALAFSPDGKRVVSASWDRTLRLWDLATGREIMTLSGHQGGVRAVAYSPDGWPIASGGADKTVRLWDARVLRDTKTLRGHEAAVLTVAFSPDGEWVASGGRDGKIVVWRVGTGQEFAALRGHSGSVCRLAFSPGGKRIASAGWDKTVRVWDYKTSRETMTLRGHSAIVFCVAFSPDGKRLVSGSWDNTLKVWDTEKGREIKTLSGHKGAVRAVAFRPDGKRVASGSDDGTVRLWVAETGREVMTLREQKAEVKAVAFSPDGGRVVSGGMGNRIAVWDAGTGREVMALRGHRDYVDDVAFSPDGRRIVSGSRDTTLRVWDSETGREFLTLTGHGLEVTAVAFSPDGKLIASASEDTTVKIWEADRWDAPGSKGHAAVGRGVALQATQSGPPPQEGPLRVEYTGAPGE